MVAQVDSVYRKHSLKRVFVRYISYLFYEGRPLTTKGRWFNKIVFFLYKIQFKFFKDKLRRDPVFILGTGRSGTTILGITLSMHPDIGFLNEPKAVWAYADNSEDIIGSYNLKVASYRKGKADVSQVIKNKVRVIYSCYQRLIKSQLILDKYPELVFRVDYVKEIFPDAKFIFLVRNGWETANSISNWSERLGQETADDVIDWWGLNDRKWKYMVSDLVSSDIDLSGSVDKIKSYDDHVHRAIVEWILTMKEGLRVKEMYPEDVFLLKYEDYVSSEQTRQAVLEFMQLGFDNNYASYCAKALKPAKTYKKSDVPLELQASFNKLMRELGYGSGVIGEE